MSRIVSIAAVIVLAAVLVCTSTPEADGCAAVPREGHPSITIAQESAIIVWDPVKKVQHFIRRAAFDTKSPDFGFLVPTPNAPQVPLKEVEDTIFQAVDKWMLPKVVEQTKLKFAPLLCAPFFAMKVATGRADMAVKEAAPSVRVLHEQKVGGFEVAVLEADNTSDLSEWLKKNNYSNDPELQSWLVPYVANKWKITAFKISQDPNTGALASTKAVRMSFAAEKPFFPYREPEGKKEKDGDVAKFRQPKQVQTEVDGIWKVERVDGGDKDGSKLVGTSFWFANGVVSGRYLKDTRFKLDSEKQPKWIDAAKVPGIYKIEGDTLSWSQGSETRPSDFDPKQGLVITLRRDTKAEEVRAAQSAKAAEWERLHGGGRLLRVFFVSDKRMEGKLGTGAWHANTSVNWSDELTEEQRKQLIQETGVPESEIPAKAWMTSFNDSASPRPGSEEVYFEPSADQSAKRPPDIIRYHDFWIPIDIVILGVLVLMIICIAVKVMWKKSASTT